MGAAGLAIGKILRDAGYGELIGVDSTGSITRTATIELAKNWFTDHTNPDRKAGTLQDVLEGADIFIGVSAPDLIDASDLRDVEPDRFRHGQSRSGDSSRGGRWARCGHGHRPGDSNQINNVLFPGIFRGAFDVGAHSIPSR